jgi:hypothetical protein
VSRLVDDPAALHEHLVRLAVEAHERGMKDAEVEVTVRVERRMLLRDAVEQNARERMAQIVQAIVLEVAT